MRRASAYSFVVFSSVIACSGCTSYTSKPILNEDVESGKQEMISSFTYEVSAPWKDSRFGKSAYEATQKMIPSAKDNSSRLIASTLPQLEIKISEFSSGGACAQEYLTGLSLGLIPSWCTRPEVMSFNFTLIKSQGLCRKKNYSISSMAVSHLILIPFALFDTGKQPLAIYQAALRDFLQESRCVVPLK